MSFQDIESGNPFARPISGGRTPSSRPSDPAELVTNNINQLNSNIPQIQKILFKLGTPQDSDELRDSLRILIGKTRDLIRDTSQALRQFSTELESSPGDRSKNKLLQGRLTKDFQNCCQKFQDLSRQSAQKERDFPLPKPSASRGRGVNIFDDSQQPEEKKALLSERTQFVQVEYDREFNEFQISDREKGIKEIETAMLEVNEISRDLNNLVFEQGKMIDNIESHIDTTVHETTVAVEEVRAADQYDRSGRSKICWIVCIITVVLIVVLVIILAPILIHLGSST